MTYGDLLGTSRIARGVALSIAGLTFSLTGGSSVADAAIFQWRPVAVSNTPAPGLPDANARFTGGFGRPAIDESGHIVFKSVLANTPILTAVYQTGANAEGLSPVAYDNQPAPGIPGVEYAMPRVETIAGGGGQVAFWTDLNATNPGSHIGSAIYGLDPQNPQLLMRSGDPALGIANATFRDQAPWTNFSAGGGRVAFLTSASVSFGTGIVDGIWRKSGAAPGLIAYSTMPTPDGTGTFSSVDLLRVIDTGQVAFTANTGVGGTSLWLGTPGDVHQAVSGSPGGILVTGGGTFIYYQQAQQGAIRRRPDGSTMRLATTGEQAPGLPSGVFFNRMSAFASGHDGDAVAFTTSLFGNVTATSDSAAYLYTSAGTLRLIAREGDAAPGTAPGVVFTDQPFIYANDANQLVMYNELAGPGVTNANARGLWCDVGDGQLQLLLRQGDNFAVNGANKVIREIDFTVDSPAAADVRFNEAGQFVIGLTFTDNSAGIFTVQVPEPAATTIALLSPISLLARRRARR